MTIKKTEPTRGLLQGGEYIHSTQTDIRALFARIRAEQQPKAKNVQPLRKSKP